MRSALFITYNGLLEPIAQAQALPYLRRLAAAGYRMVILSFEKPGDLRRAGPRALRQRQQELAAAGIRWRWLRYHKAPSVPATVFDIGCGIVVGGCLALRHRCRIIHARGTVPAVMGRWIAKLLRRKFLFDMRGLMAEEYADGGLWPRESRRFRLVSRIERRALAAADAVVVLTGRIQQELSRNGWARPPLPPMTVIPCCVDLERFQPRERDRELAGRLGLEGAFIILYVGSLGTWYLLEEMLDWFAIVHRSHPESRLVLVTQTDPSAARRAIQARRLDEQVVIASAAPEEMPCYWSLGDAAVSFIQPTFSKGASSPTKIGEALACGVPVVVNRGVGDVDALVERYRCGVIVDECTPAAYTRAAAELFELLHDAQLRPRCRRAAEEALALPEGARRYQTIYEQLVR